MIASGGSAARAGRGQRRARRTRRLSDADVRMGRREPAPARSRKGAMEADDASRGRHSGCARSGITPCPRSRRRPRHRDQAARSAAGVAEKDIVIFTRQFATMIDAGLPIVQCLDILVDAGATTRRFGKVLAT